MIGSTVVAINNMRSEPDGLGTLVVAAIAWIAVLVLVGLILRDWLKDRADRRRHRG